MCLNYIDKFSLNPGWSCGYQFVVTVTSGEGCIMLQLGFCGWLDLW